MPDSMETFPDGKGDPPHREEILEALRRLRWTLKSFGSAGLRDFPRVSPHQAEQSSPGAPSRKPAEEASHDEGLPERPPDSGSAPYEPARHGLSSVRDDLGDCRRCRLHTGRTHLVFGEGTENARLVFVGEGPGYDEDRQGRPFVGRAGKLLDKMIAALGFDRSAVYICNVVKCRPPENRTPSADEMESCAPFLFRQLEAIRPDVICALGLTAAQALLGSDLPMNRLRGRAHRWRGIPVVCTYHPAYLLRTPAQKAAAWQDLLRVEQLLHEPAHEIPG